jgi:hypothetical protein
VVWSDTFNINVDDWDASVTVNADNAGTPASGDVCEVFVRWSNGDVLGDSGDDFDTTEHAEFLMRLDTVAANTPGEDPARRTVSLGVSGKKALQIGVSCPQAATRNIVVRARIVTHRAA